LDIKRENKMSEEKKICPFMNTLNPLYTTGDQHIYCCKDKCMAWGVIGSHGPSYDEVKEGKYKRMDIHGCKLINKPV
jgi:hypothetical protein